MKRTSLLTMGLALVFVAGCSSSDIIDLIAPDVQGSWSSQVTNGNTATLTNCTGDLAALEGQTFNQAIASDMFCTVSGSLDVLQVDGNVAISPQSVMCDSGSIALVTGTGSVGETTVSGEFQGVNGNGDVTVNGFTGTVSGNTLSVQQATIEVSGNSAGTCAFTPALETTITVQ